MSLFSHQLALAFTVESDKRNGSDITPFMILKAVRERLRDMPAEEIIEACLPPIDTDEIAKQRPLNEAARRLVSDLAKEI